MKNATKDVLLVDGYNVINAWPEFAELQSINLSHARDKLIDTLAGYGAFKNYKVIVVFDAHLYEGLQQVMQISTDLQVVYTDEGETADSYIEKTAYILVRQGERVYVATSDWAEQTMILGVGAYRISSRELLADVKRFEKHIRDNFIEDSACKSRHELFNRLSGEVAKKLEELRRRM